MKVYVARWAEPRRCSPSSFSASRRSISRRTLRALSTSRSSLAASSARSSASASLTSCSRDLPLTRMVTLTTPSAPTESGADNDPRNVRTGMAILSRGCVGCFQRRWLVRSTARPKDLPHVTQLNTGLGGGGGGRISDGNRTTSRATSCCICSRLTASPSACCAAYTSRSRFRISSLAALPAARKRVGWCCADGCGGKLDGGREGKLLPLELAPLLCVRCRFLPSAVDVLRTGVCAASAATVAAKAGVTAGAAVDVSMPMASTSKASI